MEQTVDNNLNGILLNLFQQSSSSLKEVIKRKKPKKVIIFESNQSLV